MRAAYWSVKATPLLLSGSGCIFDGERAAGLRVPRPVPPMGPHAAQEGRSCQ